MEKERQNRENGLHFRKTAHFLYGKVFCVECGEPYRRFTARKASGELYKTWRCRGRTNGNGCRNSHIDEETLLKAIGGALKLDADQLSEQTVEGVERVEVTDGEARVSLKTQEKSAWE